MDEVVITIRCKKHWLWRAIDADVFDIAGANTRNSKAARRFFKRLIAQFGQPRVVITDKLKSYINLISAVAPMLTTVRIKALIT